MQAAQADRLAAVAGGPTRIRTRAASESRNLPLERPGAQRDSARSRCGNFTTVADVGQGMKLRILLAALGLSTYAILHGWSAIEWYLYGLPLGLSLTLAVNAVGCATAAYGLIRRRPWARCLALAIAVVALTQISSMGVIDAVRGQTPPVHGFIQWLACGLLALAVTGPRMRASFEEAPTSPWRFGSGLARLTRAAVIAGVGAVPMLFWMAANAVYATDPCGRIVATAAGVSMIGALVLLIRARTIGLLLFGLSSLAGVIGAVLTVAMLDTNPGHASQHEYWSRTVGAAAAMLPGVVLGATLFAAFVPRMIRYLRPR